MPSFDETIYREYDVRGTVPSQLNPEVAYHLARAYATFMGRRHGVQDAVVGHDLRTSSRELYEATMQGLMDSGLRVVGLGLVATPMLYFAQIHLGVRGGIMVTGSHNPPDYNGFKLCAHEHGTLWGEQIQEIRRLVEREDYVSGSGWREEVDLFPAYLEAIRRRVELGPRRLKVVVDAGNGTTSLFYPKVLEALGAEVIPLYCEPDPSFPHHHPDPVVEENLQDLIRTVKEVGADVGIGFDGDGDRIGVVDEEGHILWGDYLMILFSREVLRRQPGAKIIVEVKCSELLYQDVLRHGGEPLWSPTGHSRIKALMWNEGALLAGELSGHIVFRDEYFGFDDACYAAARLLRILSHTQEPLSRLLADLPPVYATPEVRPQCSDHQKFAIVEEAVRCFKRSERDLTLDGIRFYLHDGWGLIRASNTQPALIVRAEAFSPEGRERIKEAISSFLAQYPEVEKPKW